MAKFDKDQQEGLADVSHVVEVVSGAIVGDTDYLNAHLDVGWVLLAISRAGHKPLYSLGWHRSKGPPVFPEKPKNPFADFDISIDNG